MTTKVTADSLRDNGTPTFDSSDGCTVASLTDSGVKWENMKATEANRYATLANAYREAGVVYIGEGTEDGITKGLKGESPDQNNGTGNKISGSKNMTIDQIVRHTEGYDDTMRQYVANSSGQLLGQIIAADIPINKGEALDSWQEYIKAVRYLNENLICT
jgi:hypothetical protein